MERLPLVLLIVSVIVYGTDALTCPSCSYTELPKEFTDAGISIAGLGSEVACRDGGSSLTSLTCPTPDSGEKAVCIQSKANLKLVLEAGGKKGSIKMTMYTRGCHHVAEDEDDEGNIPTSEFDKDVDDLFDDFNSNSGGVFTITVKSSSGSVQYCSTDDCAEDDDITKLSGVTSLLPSMLVVALAMLVRLF